MVWKYFLAWLPGIPIAIINGSLRQFGYRPFMGELEAHQLSTLSFLILFGFYVWFIIPWMKFTKKYQPLYLGIFWLVLTIIFEFVFGYYVRGYTWEKLFYDYNLLDGRLWILVLIWIFISPLLINKLRTRNKINSTA